MCYSGLNRKYEVNMNQNRFDKLGLVDYLNEMKQPSDFDSRKKLYQSLFSNIPVNYTGSAEQNTELANSLRDTYKSVGSNLGNRKYNDALRVFADKTRARSVFEGNRNRQVSPNTMSGYEDYYSNPTNNYNDYVRSNAKRSIFNDYLAKK